jgi:hypothetical protein
MPNDVLPTPLAANTTTFVSNPEIIVVYVYANNCEARWRQVNQTKRDNCDSFTAFPTAAKTPRK